MQGLSSCMANITAYAEGGQNKQVLAGSITIARLP